MHFNIRFGALSLSLSLSVSECVCVTMWLLRMKWVCLHALSYLYAIYVRFKHLPHAPFKWTQCSMLCSLSISLSLCCKLKTTKSLSSIAGRKTHKTPQCFYFIFFIKIGKNCHTTNTFARTLAISCLSVRACSAWMTLATSISYAPITLNSSCAFPYYGRSQPVIQSVSQSIGKLSCSYLAVCITGVHSTIANTRARKNYEWHRACTTTT